MIGIHMDCDGKNDNTPTRKLINPSIIHPSHRAQSNRQPDRERMHARSRTRVLVFDSIDPKRGGVWKLRYA